MLTRGQKEDTWGHPVTLWSLQICQPWPEAVGMEAVGGGALGWPLVSPALPLDHPKPYTDMRSQGCAEVRAAEPRI